MTPREHYAIAQAQRGNYGPMTHMELAALTERAREGLFVVRNPDGEVHEWFAQLQWDDQPDAVPVAWEILWSQGPRCETLVRWSLMRTCRRCEGSCVARGVRCRTCKGKGYVTSEREFHTAILSTLDGELVGDEYGEVTRREMREAA